MKKIIKYVAFDDAEFHAEAECLTHEQDCMLASRIMGRLTPRPVCGEFEAGDAYIQHDRNKVETVRELFLGFCVRYPGVTNPGEFSPGHVRAMLEKNTPASIFKHWQRLGHIDAIGREWGQLPYVRSLDAGAKRLN
jgi:hypothetical protein